MHGSFPKASYTWNGLVGDVTRFLQHLARVSWTRGESRASSAFLERIMLAVTAVNGCRYCSWVHVRAALKTGTSKKDALAMLGQRFDHVDGKELVALLFAQHHAETRGNVERENLKALVRARGVVQASRILLAIAAITIGNLAGNTIDAFESRLRGRPPARGSRMLEAIMFVAGKPLVLLAGMR